MQSKTDEILIQLNRLANDRSLTLQTRNKIRIAVQHIRELQFKLKALKSETESRRLDTA